MANLDAPFGFRPTRHALGGTPGRLNEYEIASAYDTSIFTGDPVVGDGAQGIILATNATAILGIFMGVNFVNADGSVEFSPYWPADTVLKAGTIAKALVNDDAGQLYMVQGSGSLTKAEVGLLVNLAYTAGDENSGQSRAEVSTAASTENQFRVERILEVDQRNSDGNYQKSAGGTNAIVEVSIAKHSRTLAHVAPASTEV